MELFERAINIWLFMEGEFMGEECALFALVA